MPVTIIYKRNQCEVRDSAFIKFIEKPVITITPDITLCIFDSLFTLTASVNGGTWSGQGVDPNTGIINLNNAGEGMKTYTYSFQPNTSCAQTQTVNIDIKTQVSICMPDPINRLVKELHHLHCQETFQPLAFGLE
ncbi:MAG: hypothetical protein IPO92_18435 [Saprospiraceae bacterium]|nr:hypothetical protein [Saprospiraceae bacterium]